MNMDSQSGDCKGSIAGMRRPIAFAACACLRPPKVSFCAENYTLGERDWLRKQRAPAVGAAHMSPATRLTCLFAYRLRAERGGRMRAHLAADL